MERKKCTRILFYLLGLLTLALGLTLNTKTNLGVSPIVSAPYCISLFWNISFGNATLAVYCIFIVAELLLQRGKDWLRTLAQLPLSLVFTQVLDLMGILLPPQPNRMMARLSLLLLAILCTGTGAALTLSVDLVPNPGDGIVHALATATGAPTGTIKNFVDLSMVMIALAISGASGDLFCGVGVGTLLGVLGVGRVVAWFDKRWKIKIQRVAGINAKDKN